jgi:hypothetical protein
MNSKLLLVGVAISSLVAASVAHAQSRSEYYPLSQKRQFAMFCWLVGGFDGSVTPGRRVDGRTAFAHGRIGYGFKTAEQAKEIEDSILAIVNPFGRSSPENGEIVLKLMDRCEREYPLR